MKQHERKQSQDFGFVGHQAGQDACEPDGFGTELLADERFSRGRFVALIEDEIDHPQDRVEALWQQVVRRDAVGDPGVADLALRPNEPLRERRLGQEESPSDFGRREAAERSQRQRHLRLHCQRRVAARENEAKPIVGDGTHLLRPSFRAGALGLQLGQLREEGLLFGEPLGPSNAIDGLVPRGRRDPGARVVGHAAQRPLLKGDDERFLDGLFSQVEVAEDADERRDRPPRLVAEQAVDNGMGFGKSAIVGRLPGQSRGDSSQPAAPAAAPWAA